VSLQHLQMKKNRPGFLLRVLARPTDRDLLARIVFAESTAIGVRIAQWDRLVLARESVRLATEFGPVRVKVVTGVDGRREFSPSTTIASGPRARAVWPCARSSSGSRTRPAASSPDERGDTGSRRRGRVRSEARSGRRPGRGGALPPRPDRDALRGPAPGRGAGRAGAPRSGPLDGGP
ncbi:LarC family nickel insertion protein, partial [Myxococcota bacterium]|nr:LarC family nickel insertion protein [Myxococcota bacterium]